MLVKFVSEIKILNRTSSRANTLCEYLSSLKECKATISSDSLNKNNVSASLQEANILVNTTPLGMYPKTEDSPVDREHLRPGLLVFDAVYNPPLTKLLRDAQASGSRVLTGVSMLVYQGVVAFELWTGKKAPELLMKESVLDSLGSSAK
jgi:shikimate dehydrogenase